MATVSQKVDRLGNAAKRIDTALRTALVKANPDADGKRIGAMIAAAQKSDTVPTVGDSVAFGPMFAGIAPYDGATGTVTPGGIIRAKDAGWNRRHVPMASVVVAFAGNGGAFHAAVPAGYLVRKLADPDGGPGIAPGPPMGVYPMPDYPGTLTRNLVRWPDPDRALSVPEYVARFGDTGRATLNPDTLPIGWDRPLPECDGSTPTGAMGSVDPAWGVRRAAILRNRDTVRAVHLDRCYRAGFVHGTDALRAHRLKLADLRRFAVPSV